MNQGNNDILQQTCLVAERDPTADEAPGCASLAEFLSGLHQHSQDSEIFVGTLVSVQQADLSLHLLASQETMPPPEKTLNIDHLTITDHLGYFKRTLRKTIVINFDSLQRNNEFT